MFEDAEINFFRGTYRTERPMLVAHWQPQHHQRSAELLSARLGALIADRFMTDSIGVQGPFGRPFQGTFNPSSFRPSGLRTSAHRARAPANTPPTL